ncbi:hypothetical protein [Mycolicibacterium sphagni]|uniref:Uncharacterized protein n=1 Tax=Mycolicibacterium sphagni TaxID=1786 RepID=A0A255DRQ0_9MYCO|nr:hypothetical protein [Mycolicibacterium sphagni]OYN81760.1 hypothetical protein CG716_05300 [Mycolicibacterium sphagni]
MTNTVKWVSPTGFTVMHQAEDGTVSYTFPSEPHPQLEAPVTSKGTLGLKPMTDAAMAVA